MLGGGVVLSIALVVSAILLCGAHSRRHDGEQQRAKAVLETASALVAALVGIVSGGGLLVSGEAWRRSHAHAWYAGAEHLATESRRYTPPADAEYWRGCGEGREPLAEFGTWALFAVAAVAAAWHVLRRRRSRTAATTKFATT